MSKVIRRIWLLFAASLMSAAPGLAQQVFDDPPRLLSARAEAPRDAKHRQAMELYGDALLDERHGRVPDATGALEKAAALEPRAALSRELIGLYLAAERFDDALAACRKVLEADPTDCETWYAYASQLRERGRAKEAMAALQKGVACPSLKRRRDLRAQMYADLAGLYEDAQDAAQAEAAYREVLVVLNRVIERLPPDVDPVRREALRAKAVETYDRVIRLCTQARLYDRAISAYEEARTKGLARAGQLAYQLAKVYLARGQAEQALRLIDEYVQTQPVGTEAYELRVELLKKLGRDKQIVPSLEEYARRDARNVALQLLLAKHYEAAGRPRDAEAVYVRLADDSPGPDVYRGLFGLLRNGRAGEGVALLDKTIAAAAGSHGDPAAASRARAMLGAIRDDEELVRDFAAAGCKSAKLASETRRLLAALAARSSQWAVAEQLYRACLDDYLPPEAEREVYGGLLEILWSAHKYQDLVEICRRGLEEAEEPAALPFHRILAVALAHTGNASEALAEADEAIKQARPDDRRIARLTRIDVLRRAGRYPEAIADCQALLKEASEPKEVRELHLTLSNIYSGARDLVHAEAELRVILKTDPDDATANNDLGYLLADQGKNLAEAEDMIRKALRLDREQKHKDAAHGTAVDNGAYLDSLGWVLFRRGQDERARVELEKAVQLPDAAEDPLVWDHLADVYARLKRTADARASWQKALKLYDAQAGRKPDPEYQEIRHKLHALEPAAAR